MRRIWYYARLLAVLAKAHPSGRLESAVFVRVAPVHYRQCEVGRGFLESVGHFDQCLRDVAVRVFANCLALDIDALCLDRTDIGIPAIGELGHAVAFRFCV